VFGVGVRQEDEMIEIMAQETDAREFVANVSAVISAALAETGATLARIIKIDHYFGQRWLAFSHKALGALGIATTDLVVPAFVPSRVAAEEELGLSAGEWRRNSAAPRSIHRRQTSAANAQRKLSRVGANTAFFWWSGASGSYGRGSILAYLPTAEGHVPWYVELAAKEGVWRPVQLKGLSSTEFARLCTLGRSQAERDLAPEDPLRGPHVK